ncbi:hypothetical protein H4219_005165 [Mycoemilia scoparia]|uniref:Ras-GEF domain-containing protein n=1 Tax=Mycoemilia scoparia TaxID=417184 RepID=A0A9W7ZX96_9FUNG|nr:hypothetical protein H4219_005165 [Mycoemilia scoparia]
MPNKTALHSPAISPAVLGEWCDGSANKASSSLSHSSTVRARHNAQCGCTEQKWAVSHSNKRQPPFPTAAPKEPSQEFPLDILSGPRSPYNVSWSQNHKNISSNTTTKSVPASFIFEKNKATLNKQMLASEPTQVVKVLQYFAHDVLVLPSPSSTPYGKQKPKGHAGLNEDGRPRIVPQPPLRTYIKAVDDDTAGQIPVSHMVCALTKQFLETTSAGINFCTIHLFPPPLVAYAIAYQGSLMFKRLTIEQIIDHLFTKTPERNVVAFVDNFNFLTRLVEKSILTYACAEQRADGISWWIQVAESLRSLGDYQHLKCIISALSTFPIHRLGMTWGCVSAYYRAKLEHLRVTVVSDTKNYHYYREEMGIRSQEVTRHCESDRSHKSSLTLRGVLRAFNNPTEDNRKKIPTDTASLARVETSELPKTKTIIPILATLQRDIIHIHEFDKVNSATNSEAEESTFDLTCANGHGGHTRRPVSLLLSQNPINLLNNLLVCPRYSLVPSKNTLEMLFPARRIDVDAALSKNVEKGFLTRMELMTYTSFQQQERVQDRLWNFVSRDAKLKPKLEPLYSFITSMLAPARRKTKRSLGTLFQYSKNANSVRFDASYDAILDSIPHNFGIRVAILSLMAQDAMFSEPWVSEKEIDTLSYSREPSARKHKSPSPIALQPLCIKVPSQYAERHIESPQYTSSTAVPRTPPISDGGSPTINSSPSTVYSGGDSMTFGSAPCKAVPNPRYSQASTLCSNFPLPSLTPKMPSMSSQSYYRKSIGDGLPGRCKESKKAHLSAMSSYRQAQSNGTSLPRRVGKVSSGISIDSAHKSMDTQKYKNVKSVTGNCHESYPNNAVPSRASEFKTPKHTNNISFNGTFRSSSKHHGPDRRVSSYSAGSHKAKPFWMNLHSEATTLYYPIDKPTQVQCPR